MFATYDPLDISFIPQIHPLLSISSLHFRFFIPFVFTHLSLTLPSHRNHVRLLQTILIFPLQISIARILSLELFSAVYEARTICFIPVYTLASQILGGEYYRKQV